MKDESSVWIYHYRLRVRKGRLNAASTRREHDGLLIRHKGGHGCIHPWPELGDPTLVHCLQDLKGPRRKSIVRRALRCAEFDRVGREFDHSLFEDLEVPDNHATITSKDSADIAAAVTAGFRTVKLKIGRNPVEDARSLCQLASDFPDLRWRLDANEQFHPAQAEEFIQSLDRALIHRIDFLEDPCPYSDSTWPRLFADHRIPLAVDREAAPITQATQVMVLKPGLDEPTLLGEAAAQHGQSIVVTSSMDHPVGQAFAAFEAGSLSLRLPGLVGLCGLQTHHLFETDSFTERLGAWSPQFHPPDGLGLGFDDLLDALPWKKI